MSLLEALLLDPAPFDTWVSYRPSGVKGSGTLHDPWNIARYRKRVRIKKEGATPSGKSRC